MKLRTRWKRVYNPIIGVRFFDAREYGLGYFTIEKLWHCKENCKHTETSSGSHWFDRVMMKVRTDTGFVYKMPFCPWYKMYSGEKSLADFYNENPCMSKRKLKNKEQIKIMTKDLIFMLDNMKNWKDIHDKDVDTICKGMSKTERKAYCMGVNNLFNLFSAIVEKNFVEGNCTVLCPVADIESQECDIEELNRIISKTD